MIFFAFDWRIPDRNALRIFALQTVITKIRMFRYIHDQKRLTAWQVAAVMLFGPTSS